MSDTKPESLAYDVDKRFAQIRVEVLGEEYTDVVRVCEQFPDLPDGITVYIEHVDAVDLKQEARDNSHHPCERLDWESLYETQIRAAHLLAEHGEYEASEDLWAASVGTRSEVGDR